MHQSKSQYANRHGAIVTTQVLLTAALIFFCGCGANETPITKSKPKKRRATQSNTQPMRDSQADETTPNDRTSDAEPTIEPASMPDDSGTDPSPPLVSGVAGEDTESDSIAEHHARTRLPSTYTAERSARQGSSQSPMEAFRSPTADNAPPMVDISAKVRRYAKKLVARYDLDDNGTLESGEWLQMRGDPHDDDLNGDEVLTAEELAIRIAVYGHRRMIRLMPQRRLNEPVAVANQTTTDRPAEATTATDDVEAGRKKLRRSRRFYVRSSRMPVGLPAWFVEGDTNGDAQMSLAEFSAKWSSSELDQFDTFDHDGDGMITARECARGELARQPIESPQPVEHSDSSTPTAESSR